MGEKERVISLYNYISEVSKSSKSINRNISLERWYYFLNNLPLDENINFNNLYDENIIEIKKPNFLRPIKLEKKFIVWIDGNWENFKEKIKIKKEIIIEKVIINEEKKEEIVSEIIPINEEILKTLTLKKQERDIWVKEQEKIENVRKIFDALYIQYLELNKESEMLELVLANGMLKMSSYDIYYPIILKKIKLEFNAEENIIYIKNFIENGGYLTELYTEFLNEIENINLNGVLELDTKVKEKDIYPLDVENIDNFFREFVHKLSVNGQYSKDIENFHLFDKESVIIEDNPLIFIRKKDSGVIKAIDEIVKNIEEIEEIPEQLSELIGLAENEKTLDKISKEENKENILNKSENVISKDGILFVKEANIEQIEIAQKIEKNRAVVVQGPPGTGKTHTIANLLGHFLAQGKNVLVTSHTKKALKVLKDKIPKNIQGLCISILDDDNSDMSRSVENITENMGRLDSIKLKKEVDILEQERLKEIKELKKINTQLFSIKYKENQSIFYNGEGFSITELGRYLRKNEERLNKINGKIEENTPCPISNEEFKFLKEYRIKVSKEDEKEIELNLNDSNFFKTKDEFKDILEKLDEKREKVEILLKNKEFYYENDSLIFEELGRINLQIFEKSKLKDDFIPIKLKNIKKWELYLIRIGANNGNNKLLWEVFLDEVRKVADLVATQSLKFFGKEIKFELEIIEGKKQVLELKEAINNPGLFLKNRLKKAKNNLGNKIQINGKILETIEECDLVLEYLDLMQKKDELNKKWKTFSITDINIDEILDNPKKFIENVLYYLNWNEREKFEFIKNIKQELGIDIKLIFGKLEIMELNELPMYIEKIEKYINISNKALEYMKLFQLYDDYAQLVLENTNENSVIENGIREAVINKDIENYDKFLKILELVSNKTKLYNKRKEILNKIKKVANEWAMNLFEENYDREIDDIYEVWKWKQLSQELEKLQNEPYEKLQKEVRDKKEKIKNLTLELVEKKSWYYVLSFVEKKENLTISQSLRGWKRSMEKIGKGTGKNAEKHRNEAKNKIAICQKAVPIWIMPMNKVIDTLNPAKNKFDIVIVDEASQSDISALVLLYMAKKVIIVGDDKQVSPSAVGVKIEKENLLIEKYLKGRIINSDLYGMRSSLYLIASTTYQPLMLREHFRCVPEIIGYSNKTSYDFKIKPLREASSSKLTPAVINYRVDGKRGSDGKVNEVEAKTIVSLIMACLEEDIYEKATFGVISLLGKEQVDFIQNLLVEKIGNGLIEEHEILCGDPSHFQGDEKDIIFLSMVDSNKNSEVPLKLKSEGKENENKKRYNVATSRAKDQLWLVHSLDVRKDLKIGDIRRELIEFTENPRSFMIEEEVKSKSDSIFEEEVAKYLLARDYNLYQQWEVGAYRLDMVVSCGENRVAIECDGERWHSSEEQIKNDIERQEILERCGWKFIRIRGSKYFRNPDLTMKEVVKELNIRGIYPEKQESILNKGQDNKLLNKIKNRAQEILLSWKDDKDKKEERLDEESKVLNREDSDNKAFKEIKEEKTVYPKNENRINKIFDKINLEGSNREKVKKDIYTFLSEESIEYIDNSKTSNLLWIIYSSEKEGKIETYLQENNYSYSFDKRGARATNNRKAWRVKMEG